ncbi:hypothetical protein [Deinococcus rufus]|uniref:Uncharacterized protein n=1 Tax=Deinococcus rufus TaxID=2136097 RepID=A0ABV7Z7L6_9DEIO
MTADPFRHYRLTHPEVHAWVTAAFRVEHTPVAGGTQVTVLLGLEPVTHATAPSAAVAEDLALDDADFLLRTAIREAVEAAA